MARGWKKWERRGNWRTRERLGLFWGVHNTGVNLWETPDSVTPGPPVSPRHHPPHQTPQGVTNLSIPEGSAQGQDGWEATGRANGGCLPAGVSAGGYLLFCESRRGEELSTSLQGPQQTEKRRLCVN